MRQDMEVTGQEVITNWKNPALKPQWEKDSE